MKNIKAVLQCNTRIMIEAQSLLIRVLDNIEDEGNEALFLDIENFIKDNEV